MKNTIMAVLLVLAISLIATALLIMDLSEKTTKNKTASNKTPDIKISLQTNASSYAPAEPVKLTGLISDNHFSGTLIVEIYHLGKKIKEDSFQAEEGHFTRDVMLPENDFQGYLMKVSSLDYPSVLATIAVDISSDWSKFPRYGFLSEFDHKSQNEIDKVLENLNRFHMNGLQFYDYHYKHHQPIKMDGSESAKQWEDIANRTTSFDTLKRYIKGAHERNIKAMAYNLVYGTFEDAEHDGVNKDWYLYRDKQRTKIDFHPLPENWKSNVLLMNPSHPGWQDFIIRQQENVYRSLNFDGWHIDQLGNRGEVFNEHGDLIRLDETFQNFLQKIKTASPSKSIVMNAVNQYGQAGIANSPVDFLYTEVWDENKYYSDLKRIIDENSSASNYRKNTVLAAYMNYDASESKGEFNEAGILLANSVIFASGGSHLELGEHMLSKEYFPHHQLTMSSTLNNKLISYYDFLAGYQNLLRDGVSAKTMWIEAISGPEVTNRAEKGKIWAFAKQKGNSIILHFINLSNASHLEWRDNDAKQSEPISRKGIKLKTAVETAPRRVWFASPDLNGGIPKELKYSYKNGVIYFALPSLKYWDMVVIEVDA